ncbi:MAG: peptidase domain-containing ABC transporter [Rhodospirillales bacterium]
MTLQAAQAAQAFTPPEMFDWFAAPAESRADTDALAALNGFAPPPADNRAGLAALKEQTDLSNCLAPLLEALGWRGDPRHIAEAAPHFAGELDLTAFRNVMANLHYESRPVRTDLKDLDPRLTPCLFLPDGGDAAAVLSVKPAHYRIYDGGRGEYMQVPKARAWKGTAYLFSRIEEDDLPAPVRDNWFASVAERFHGLLYQTIGLTLVLSILGLAAPLFVMAVYDKVVATGALDTLTFLAVGAGAATAVELLIRAVRARIMSHVGARLDSIAGAGVFHRILFLAPQFTERATVGAQVARIKDFENIRQFFTGPAALPFFELPFALALTSVIALLGGPLAFVPLVTAALFVLLGVVIFPLMRKGVARAARGASQRQELVIETLGAMRVVKDAGAEAVWLERFRTHSAAAALNGFKTAHYSALTQTLAGFLMSAAGMATIVFGAFRVLDGAMTIGALVASMILVWRVLAPMQSVFVSMPQLLQMRSSVQQINALMKLRAEREPNTLVSPIPRFKGAVSFSRVSLRYKADADPALVGVSFDVDPGEVVCVVGGNGSGKSTVLKTLAGMCAPQAGNVRIDNRDIRQMDAVELRHAVGYAPQSFQFFYGTIAQNLRLARPTASDEELRWAAERADVLADIEALEQGLGEHKRRGFDVRIGTQGSGAMPAGFLQRLNLARTFLKRAPLMLFDEPGAGLDACGDQAFMRHISAVRGHATVFIATHRPSHLNLADKIIWLESGQVRAQGPADEVRKLLPNKFL